MALDELEFVRLEGSVKSLSEAITRFEHSVDRMAEKTETGNLKRDEAIGELSRKIGSNAQKLNGMPQKIQILETWMIESKAKNSLVKALPGIISGIVGAGAALLAFTIYFQR